ncbi:glycoside hydrolase family 73 protein [Paraburkholderia caballeronis]|uniref:Flagellar protein FlgJ n=1 Tax=Paraburkholderia caballeronis TaxID=416943 RepID=A0A1H7TZM2_9BURK|nr:glycoside hydrolase family 73 protein [Paraburkholderia caballeronis]PXW23423.1 flagellar protein FlgJ [Paraburkholderia caballeronis]PXW98416.1 flagellar protein FlgJ [Paraburkholderia caballeronis]RAJ95147.1 flagellar protein FlgJ [Paraburkholderia caballeronis]SEC54292.1 flagellar protein FlgJ [Paraburkholderia caballeronis]SEL90133.1 flagellar protein FlgJ [Paraburkholderia caballeronis]
MQPDDFIDAIAPAARELATTTKIPASFTIAQAALESGWAKSQLAQRYFNLFGVKADRSWTGPTVVLPTTEYENGKPVTVNATWRVYDSWLASIRDRAQFLLDNPRYAPAFAYTSGATFARAVAAAGYATDPNYAAKLISIIKTHNLSALDI